MSSLLLVFHLVLLFLFCNFFAINKAALLPVSLRETEVIKQALNYCRRVSTYHFRAPVATTFTYISITKVAENVNSPDMNIC